MCAQWIPARALVALTGGSNFSANNQTCGQREAEVLWSVTATLLVPFLAFQVVVVCLLFWLYDTNINTSEDSPTAGGTRECSSPEPMTDRAHADPQPKGTKRDLALEGVRFLAAVHIVVHVPHARRCTRHATRRGT